MVYSKCSKEFGIVKEPQGGYVDKRFLVVCGVLLASAFWIRFVSHGEEVPPRRKLDEFPSRIGDWREASEELFGERVMRVLGADDYLNRGYVNPSGASVWLYIGYYRSQRQGDLIHSPKHCLPGSGWQPLRSDRITVEVQGRTVKINRYLIQKGDERQLVLYWYQSRGRTIASEYVRRFWLVFDAMTRRRTDGALVEVFAPVEGSTDEALSSALDFVRRIFPLLPDYLPD